MEKICIVKLRKRIAPSATPAAGVAPQGLAAEGWEQASPAEEGGPSASGGEAAAGDDRREGNPSRTVTLTLTPEQAQALRSDPRLVASLAERPAERFQALRPEDEKLIIQLQFESVTPTRLLKVEEVVQMLRIGKGYVNKLIKGGQLKCYRFGRLRRILLDDVLTYLEANRERGGAPAQPEAPGVKTALPGVRIV